MAFLPLGINNKGVLKHRRYGNVREQDNISSSTHKPTHSVDLGVSFPQIPSQWTSIQRERFSVPRHDKNKAQ